jgi:hypothetical protein
MPSLNPAHGLRHTGEASLCAVAQRPIAQPSSHPAQPARARRGARAPPVVTVLWPRARRRAGTVDGVQQVASNAGRGGGAGQGDTHRDAPRRRCDDGGRGELETAAFRWMLAPVVISGLGGEWYCDKGRVEGGGCWRRGRSGRVTGAREKNQAGDGGGALLKGAQRGDNRGGCPTAGVPRGAGRAWGLAPIGGRRGHDRGGQRSGAWRRAEEWREDNGGERRCGHVEERGGPVNQRTTSDQQRPETGGSGRHGAAMPCGKPSRGGGMGLTSGPWPQCRAAALADR